jgi:hypothetical protein
MPPIGALPVVEGSPGGVDLDPAYAEPQLAGMATEGSEPTLPTMSSMQPEPEL